VIDKNSYIDKSAVVSETALIESNVYIGKNCIIGNNVKVGFGAVVECNTEIGDGTIISSHAHLGGAPQDVSYKGEDTKLVIGKNCIIREFSFIHRASTKEEWKTVIGDNCFIMASSHVGHDCVLGNGVILTSYAGLSGHVYVGDYAVLGGGALVHQFVRIGNMSMVGGRAVVLKDVPPYSMVAGHPAVLEGLNIVGLKRNGVKQEVRNELKRAISILNNIDFLLKEAIDNIEKLVQYDEIKTLRDFLLRSKRGVIRRGNG
jgi:UDP-N-acetylglucosamine acyltransferase